MVLRVSFRAVGEEEDRTTFWTAVQAADWSVSPRSLNARLISRGVSVRLLMVSEGGSQTKKAQFSTRSISGNWG